MPPHLDTADALAEQAEPVDTGGGFPLRDPHPRRLALPEVPRAEPQQVGDIGHEAAGRPAGARVWNVQGVSACAGDLGLAERSRFQACGAQDPPHHRLFEARSGRSTAQVPGEPVAGVRIGPGLLDAQESPDRTELGHGGRQGAVVVSEAGLVTLGQLAVVAARM